MNTDAPVSHTSLSCPPNSATPSPVISAEQLPNDLAVCHRMILELLATLHIKDHELEGVRHRLDQLLRRLYGPRAERYDPNQPLLFADLLPSPAEKSAEATQPAEPPKEPTEPPAKKHKGHGRNRPPKELRRERVDHDLTEAEKICPCCGQLRTKIGEEVGDQIDYVPASLYVLEHHRFKYACKHCQEQVTIAAKPAQPIDKGLPGPGLLAQVVVSKYVDHLPLHRQERLFERQGLLLNRSTTCGWMAKCAEMLKPLYELMKREVLASRVIHTDDSPVPVLDGARDTTRRGHMWTYLGDHDHPYTVFDYTPNHTNDGPKAFLKDYVGYLQADAYKGYDAIYLYSAKLLSRMT